MTFVVAGGKEITIQVKKSEYILDAGLEAGLELPYTCRSGICGACVGKVVAGEVDQSDVREIEKFVFLGFSSGIRTNNWLTFSPPVLLFTIRLENRQFIYRSMTSRSRSRRRRSRW